MENILKYNRDVLPEFLKSNFKYDHLKSSLDNLDISKLMLGTIGLESNKQRAIYELPTEELLIVLKCICDHLNIKNIEEMAAGQGLLSHMIQFYFGYLYHVKATDGFRWIETISPKRYFNVENKLFLQYCTDNINYDDKLLIVSWLPEDDIGDFLKILKIKKPKNIIIIGCTQYLYISDLMRSNLDQIGYAAVGIPVKQICYNNTYYQSSLIYLTQNSSDIMNGVLLAIKLKHNSCLCQMVKIVSDKEIIKELIGDKKYLLEHIDNTDKLKKITKSYKMIMSKGIRVPDYLENFNEFSFWVYKISEYKYPLKINTREKFKEYKKLLRTLSKENGLNKLKENGTIFDWINNTTDAEKFIWLDYSHESKKWKESQNSFVRFFTRVYSVYSNQNTFVNFVALTN